MSAPAAYTGFDRMPLAGSWRSGSSGDTETDTDPYTGDTLTEIALADSSDVDTAYRAAADAQRDWAAAVPSERPQLWLSGEPGGPTGRVLPPHVLTGGNDEINTAFGGEKGSGLGRFGGEWVIEEFTTDHWISVQHTRRSYPI